ncbi:DUF1232 domain-containing protein [Halocatena halophila]|uniref:DUF1232 domain-containing protein n=1 Tax=Halocatena halophila TaxID=2814576 RepID=UPI002ED36FDF
MKRVLRAGIVETYTVVRVALDRRSPHQLRLVVILLFVGGYLLSPVDAVSDLLPVVGLGDDLLVGLLGRRLIYGTTPAELLEEHREVARSQFRLAAVVVGLFVLLFVVIVVRSLGLL